MKQFILGLLILILTAFSAFAFDQIPKDHWAKYDGGKVHYYDIGDKKAKNALILIHGWTCNADLWKDSYGSFPNYRVIAIDLPGHGKSDKPKTNYSMEYFARSIEAVMNDAKVQKAVLVGHSMGTPVIRQFYRIFPDQTLGLVVVDGALRPFGPKAQMDQFLGPLRTNYKENSTKMVDGLVGPMKDEVLKKNVREVMLATPDYVGISAMDGMVDEAIWTNDQIKVPVLAIMSGNGPWAPDTQVFYKTVAPNLEYIAMPAVSHFLFMDKPKEFNDSVSSFVAKNKLL